MRNGAEYRNSSCAMGCLKLVGLGKRGCVASKRYLSTDFLVFFSRMFGRRACELDSAFAVHVLLFQTVVSIVV